HRRLPLDGDGAWLRAARQPARRDGDVSSGVGTRRATTSNQPDATGTYPYWDNSTLPLNILQQAWLVNDVFIGLAAMVYLWVIFPFVSAGYAALGPRGARTVFVLVIMFFLGCCIATACYLLG
ncbi:MAG: hypothetical protein SOV20_04015, partial [Coriobacteriales bacterium]|nr:hypothetical protein [Coriobacteriales bacterium]